MNDETRKFAERAVACEGWRLMPRMHLVGSAGSGYTYLYGDPETHEHALLTGDDWVWFTDDLSGMLPDLTDPATLGCLLALVREAWGDGDIGIVTEAWATVGPGDAWQVVQRAAGRVHSSASTEAAALVAALEAAPL